MTIFCYLLLVLALACKVYWAVNLVLSAPETHTTGRPACVAVLKIENHCSPNGSMTPVLYSPKTKICYQPNENEIRLFWLHCSFILFVRKALQRRLLDENAQPL